MKTKHVRLTRNAAFGLIAALALPVPAFADTCENPHIKFINYKSTAMEIKKYKIFDECDDTWREELTPDVTLPPGFYVIKHDDLERVQGCPISAFKVYRRVQGSNGVWGSAQWGGTLYPNEGSPLCYTETRYTVEYP